MYKKSLFAVCIVIFLLSSSSFAMMTKGPYLQDTKQDSIVIRWETDSSTLDLLEWGPDETLEFSISDSAVTPFHEHRLEGLDEETTYFYRVKSFEQTSDIKTFTTAPSLCSPFRFVLVGDTRSNHLVHGLNADRMADAGPDFVINSGDIVDSEDSNWQNELLWQIHFNIERDLMAEIPLYPVFGNHDSRTEAIWERIFALPSETSGSEFYYDYKFGNSLFIVVNTQVDYTEGSTQYVWLESTLQAGYADPEVMHIFVAFHVPPFCVGDHGINQTVIDHLVPLFESYGVQAVLNGHEHNFQHLERSGVRYFVSGGGAADLDRQVTTLPELIQFNYRHHFTIFDVSGSTVSVEARDTFTGATFYTFSWEDDMGKDPCAGDDDDDDTGMDDDDTDTDDDDADTDDDDTADDDHTGPDDDDSDEDDDDEASGESDSFGTKGDDEGGCCG